MAHKSKKSLVVPLNFLFNSSVSSLSNFELARLSEINNLRRHMLEVLEQWVEASAQASIAAWWRQLNRAELLHAIEVGEDPIERAKREIREMGGGPEEPVVPLPPGVAHRAASMNYQRRNVADGLCAGCPSPLARNNVCKCEAHLTADRERMRRKSRAFNKALPGHHPNSVAALAEFRRAKQKEVQATVTRRRGPLTV
jgi:hypothetical protein